MSGPEALARGGLVGRFLQLNAAFAAELRAAPALAAMPEAVLSVPLLLLLSERGRCSIDDVARVFGISAASVRQLVVGKLVSVSKEGLSLTEQGNQAVSQIVPILNDLNVVLAEYAGDEATTSFERLEQAVLDESLSDRIREQQKTRTLERCEIVDYRPDLRMYFESLNREWLEAYFRVEPIDVEYFEHPDKLILAKGGDIFFASFDGEIVGVCSLIKEKGVLELAKMAVTAKVQGRGIGEFLVIEAIRRARAMGFDKLTLGTNSRLVTAIKLYERLGFVVTFRGQIPKYERGDVLMEKAL